MVIARDRSRMAKTAGTNSWGHIRMLPSQRFQASYVGPDLRRHNAPETFSTRLAAQGWLVSVKWSEGRVPRRYGNR
jgi:hypothetical protein